MTRFHGEIGFTTTVETSPGVHTEVLTKRNYFGDVLRDSRQNSGGAEINPGLSVGNRFSVLGDDFLFTNIKNLAYLRWDNGYWKITSVELLKPRLTITVGGVWNGIT